MEERTIAANDFEDAVAFTSEQISQWLGWFMARNEVEPEFVVGAANPIGETDSMIVAVANLADDFQESAFVARLAVHDYAIHVEDDGFYIIKLRLISGITHQHRAECFSDQRQRKKKGKDQAVRESLNRTRIKQKKI